MNRSLGKETNGQTDFLILLRRTEWRKFELQQKSFSMFTWNVVLTTFVSNTTFLVE